MNYKPNLEKDKEKISNKEEIRNDLIISELEDLFLEDEEDDNENQRDKDTEQRKQNYELQYALNKLSANYIAEDLSRMKAGEKNINNRTIGKTIKIQKGFLTPSEIKALRNAGFIIDEIENVSDVSLVENMRNPNLREKANPLQTQRNDQKNIEQQQTKQQQREQQLEAMTARVGVTRHGPDRPLVVETIRPNKPQKPTMPIEVNNPINSKTPETQRPQDIQQSEPSKSKEQTTLNGWMDNHKLDVNPNSMTASCIIHYYTEEQKNALIRAADNSLNSMLDSKKHLAQYYDRKDGQQQNKGTGWNL
jgi:hypothetical protein